MSIIVHYFCKKRDDWKAAVEANPEYNACREYNSWIETEKASFTREYLVNVRKFKSQTVDKYFSTKDHPGGHDPRPTYLKSKLNCTKYNPPPNSDSQRKTEKAPPNKMHPSTAPRVTQRSDEKNGKSLPDVDSESDKTKPDENNPLTRKTSTTYSRMPSSTKTEPDDPVNGERTNEKAKGPGPPVMGDGEKRDTISILLQRPIDGNLSKESDQTQRAKSPPGTQIPSHSPRDAALIPITQNVPQPTTATSLSSTLVIDTISSQTPDTAPILQTIPGSPSPSDPLSSAVVTNGQDRTAHTTTSVTSPNTHSTQTFSATSTADSTLAQSQPQPASAGTLPAITAAHGPATTASSSASTFTNTVTSTTAAPASVTIPTISTTHELISSPKEATSASGSQESLPTSAAVGPAATASPTARYPQKTVISAPTPLSGNDTANFSVQTKPDRDPRTITAAEVLPKPIVPIKAADNQLSKDTQQTPGNPSRTQVMIPDNNVHGTPHNRGQPISPVAVHHPPNIGVVPSTSDKSGTSVTAPKVNIKTTPKDDSTVKTNKNDNPRIIPDGIPPLTHIIPILLVILGTLTLLFQLYKYTPFGLLLGRRRKRKKQDLKGIFEIPEKPTYESPNITLHEWEDPNLGGKTVENDVYIKLLKTNRYKQKIQKKKKENKKTLIEVHMEVLEEYKSDEWELHKGDFLEICLRGFINDESHLYSNFPNSKLTINSINEKTIEDIQKQEILWNNWIENHRNILEQWKKEEWFHILKNKWRNEEQMYKEKNDKLQENMLNEQETYSVVIQKEIWKQWISKQATLIDMFNKKDWFKSMVYAQNKEKNNYHIKEYNNISLTSKTELKNEKSNHEYCRSKDIIQKLMVQIHMMVLEECIKEDIIKHKELCIDNFIEDIHTQNNYDEKRNMPQSDIDNFKVPEFEEIHTSTNK
ncbi:STP1 protein [Plasmodium ovale wallikeri]|uniref:STP1 protein n=1 Tax=Plasmodium ovale wallikeri TaxID=864142 RepID=A0A1A9AKM5_PLAOA|nr:STP1 protein [Plasmodium ovale wallikeri]